MVATEVAQFGVKMRSNAIISTLMTMVGGQMRVTGAEKAKKRREPMYCKSYLYETEFFVHQVGGSQEVKC